MDCLATSPLSTDNDCPGSYSYVEQTSAEREPREEEQGREEGQERGQEQQTVTISAKCVSEKGTRKEVHGGCEEGDGRSRRNWGRYDKRKVDRLWRRHRDHAGYKRRCLPDDQKRSWKSAGAQIGHYVRLLCAFEGPKAASNSDLDHTRGLGLKQEPLHSHQALHKV